MKQAFIDSATIHQIVQTYDREWDAQYAWSVRVLWQFTALAITADYLAMAPGLPSFRGTWVDKYDSFVQLLAKEKLLHSLDSTPHEKKRAALEQAQTWAEQNDTIVAIREAVAALHNSEDFMRWIDWVAPKAWLSHSSRLGGLFDSEFSPHVARVLKLDLDEVQDMQKTSRHQDFVEQLIRTRNRDFTQMSKAYTASILFRGRYHEHMADETPMDLVHHPLREDWLPSRYGTGDDFSVSNVLSSVVDIVVHGAGHQHTTEARLNCWVENVLAARRALNGKPALFSQAPSEEEAIPVAYSIAKNANIRMGDQRLATLCEVAVSVGVGVLAAIKLGVWGAALSVPTERILRDTGVSRKVVDYLHLSGHKLKHMKAGKLIHHWDAPSD